MPVRGGDTEPVGDIASRRRANGTVGADAQRASALTTPKQGVLSLDDYTSQLYPANSEEKQLLPARCFQTAVHMEWQAAGGNLVSVWQQSSRL